ncbi:unnamed protein product [Somion occarium]|uniref:Carboxypeptidase n=1 Tax=Somion occarium TaxID=3059160 RepID=A0ABP1CGD0_9APHY
MVAMKLLAVVVPTQVLAAAAFTIQIPASSFEQQHVLSPSFEGSSKVDLGSSPYCPDEMIEHPSFPSYQLRVIVTEPTLCDASVEQHAGFLDISDTRHLFFWFFEARNDPANAPLLLWLNGGPGCSSINAGLLFENGPCRIAEGGNGTIVNPHSWNEVANVIYLDEPIGTGFSYADDDSKVDTLADLAVDVYVFTQVFLKRFPQYSNLPFHLAAESWGGHYGPTISNFIHQENKKLVYAPRKGVVKINLASLILANGLTEPASQFESIPDYACGGAPYPFLDPKGSGCAQIKFNKPICLEMIESCYKFNTKATCTPATFQCWSTMMVPLDTTGKNAYDIRKPCLPNTKMCYEELDWATLWMNEPEVKKSLGVDANRTFTNCNMDVNQRFYVQGQAMHNSAALLPELINNGVRLLVYAGNADAVCNYMGVELWMSRLEHNFHKEFASTPSVPWRTRESNYVAGYVLEILNSSSPSLSFLSPIRHMAPHDQPEATLDMITRWIHNVPWSEAI